MHEPSSKWTTPDFKRGHRGSGMSALGQKQTNHFGLKFKFVRFGSLADIRAATSSNTFFLHLLDSVLRVLLDSHGHGDYRPSDSRVSNSVLATRISCAAAW